MSEKDRVRARRRFAAILGFAGLTSTAIAAAALGSGCIFDQGTYEGGGRRGPIQKENDEDESPTTTSTSTSTPTPPPPSTNDDPDEEELDAG